MRFGLKQAVFFPLYCAAAVRQTHIQLKSIQKEYAGPFSLAHIQYILSTVKIQVQIWKTSLCWSWLHEKVNNGRRMKCYRTVFLIPEMLYGRRQTTASISKVWDGSCIISFPSSSKAKRLHSRTGKLISVLYLCCCIYESTKLKSTTVHLILCSCKERRISRSCKGLPRQAKLFKHLTLNLFRCSGGMSRQHHATAVWTEL